MERARLIAGLARIVRDVGRAEELAQDALVAALDRWPTSGIPDNPAGWLMATAKRRAIDTIRRARMMERKHAEIGRDLELEQDSTIDAIEATMDDDIGDERLGLIFTACHPLLSMDARVALTLRLIGGLTTDEIARAFLSSETTIAQRIVRAKKSLANAGIAYEVPRGADRDARLASVLEVVYLIFNEGYAASAGEDAIRPQLCAEAMRLGRILADLAPDEPEVHGLLALMEIQSSRLIARNGPDGVPLTLETQNRARWDQLLIHRGFAALERVRALGEEDGPYALQAALAACHARARRFEDTDWRMIAGLYDRLLTVLPSPVVALNRAVAHAMAFGPETGLAQLDMLEDEPALKGYAPMAAARGDFLLRAGRLSEARVAFERAAELSGNAGERAFLLDRAQACATMG
ncbi:RNA polymerase subunit sigma-24 [Ciceribacter naphthalenivorans]|uniref:RNA polymerase subunit sigma-24 n=3 Tax=Pseudomonadota TaxID=1224 RepID=A0A512HNY9_9HYPH|nr:RNA polymerase subunit sigma-24 [Ciceribacter naphthalenivorans]GLR23258.1 RNA polymerase subunit sigma-24 [Ciceribacter naphthalenivorans]GLT06114.1 RNA polymerase subunit sigma-24 [Sphingomonas psychrolutea]